MQTLFLASFACFTLPLIEKLLSKPASEMKAAFIATAADPYQDKWFVEVDRAKLVEMGFTVIDVDLKNKEEVALKSELSSVDLILVAGGNTFYLLDQMRKSGFDVLLPELLDRGVIYVGSSAGSAVCCPTIEGALLFDDATAVPELTNYAGLNLYDKVIIPHTHKAKYAGRIEQTTENMKSKGYQVVNLTDDEAIIVQDGVGRVVSCLGKA